ncbi:hypothetical protein BD410DRAFT_834636 [Rickenella mellea]|uniref:PXA domain-containing protein n=1 Tax=Rickenella mellea TaxID=50990 RepID=A0A4Y7QMS6_9AGAM|nr:hypothetical protein BD410DRAFT_834636 [Rickenella mellea]
MSSIRSTPSTTATTTTATRPPSSVPLYRRLLFPNLPPALPPPPILPAASPELNAELYDFIALALRAYITPWWSKITRFDKEFIPHVSLVISAVLRILSDKLTTTDLAPVLLHHVPTLITQHYADYRTAASKLGTSYASGGAAALPQLFHQSQPHMAIDAEGNIDQIYLRHVLDHVLNVCLPPEDFNPDAERAIIREVIIKVLVQDIFPRLIQPWFIHKIILDLLGSNSVQSELPLRRPPNLRRNTPSFHNVVVFFLSAVQTISGLALALIHWYKQTLHTVKLVKSRPGIPFLNQHAPRHYAPCVLEMLAEVLTMRERAASNAALNCVELTTSFINPFLDRLLPHLLYSHTLTASRLLDISRISKNTLFPNGYPGPPPIDPTVEEQLLLKEQLVQLLEERIPAPIAFVILGPASPASPNVMTRRQTILSALAPLSSPQCNAHLVLLLLDLIILTLFPELGVSETAAEAGDAFLSDGSLGGRGRQDVVAMSISHSHSRSYSGVSAGGKNGVESLNESLKSTSR